MIDMSDDSPESPRVRPLDAGPRLPRVHGYRLDGSPATFPADLPDDAVLVITQHTFESPHADAWFRNARTLLDDVEPPVAIHRVVLVDREVAAVADTLVAHLRARLPDDYNASTTVVLFVDVVAFLFAIDASTLGDRTTHVAWIAAGHVLWHAFGAPTPQARRRLLQARVRRRPLA